MVVPLDLDSAEEGGVPIGVDFLIIGFGRVIQMESVIFSKIMYEEVVDDKGERDGAPGVSPNARCL